MFANTVKSVNVSDNAGVSVNNEAPTNTNKSAPQKPAPKMYGFGRGAVSYGSK